MSDLHFGSKGGAWFGARVFKVVGTLDHVEEVEGLAMFGDGGGNVVYNFRVVSF